MPEAEQFPFVVSDAASGEASLLPYLPLALAVGQRSVSALGLLDTGSAVNVLPYDVGVQLGLEWAEQRTVVRLTGSLASAEARVVTAEVTVGRFKPVRLAFAWTQARNIPLILGQVNFFLEFDVWFSRSQRVFEVRAK